jgi:hypothetical protein
MRVKRYKPAKTSSRDEVSVIRKQLNNSNGDTSIICQGHSKIEKPLTCDFDPQPILTLIINQHAGVYTPL